MWGDVKMHTTPRNSIPATLYIEAVAAQVENGPGPKSIKYLLIEKTEYE